MGGKLFAPHSERVTNEEIKVIFSELSKKLSKYFTSMALSRSIKSKMDHGDIDIIVLPKTHIDFKSVLEKELGKDLLNYSKNGYVYSFLYNSPVNKKVHVDLIAASSEEDEKSKTEYFSFNDFSAIVGMLARKLRFKYTDNGFYKKYQDEKGNYHDFLISRNLMDGLKVLGLDSSKFNRIEGQDDILKFVLESPLLDKKFFEYTELVRRDREAFDVRPGIEDLNKKIVDSGKTRQIEDDDYFFKKHFPQKYAEYLAEVEETNKKNNIQKKYSGQWLMNKFGMKPGPEMGKVLKKITDKFKDNLENTSEEDVSNFVKSLMENKIDYKEFFSYLKEESIKKDVKSKLIVYHGTGSKFKNFDMSKTTQGIIWFTSDKEKILNREAGAEGHGYIITAEVSINNPAGWEQYEKLGLGQLKSAGYDGAILRDDDGKFDCFVFSKNQIKMTNIEKI